MFGVCDKIWRVAELSSPVIIDVHLAAMFIIFYHVVHKTSQDIQTDIWYSSSMHATSGRKQAGHRSQSYATILLMGVVYVGSQSKFDRRDWRETSSPVPWQTSAWSDSCATTSATKTCGRTSGW